MTGLAIIGWAATAGSLVSLSGAVAWMRWRSRSYISEPSFGSDGIPLCNDGDVIPGSAKGVVPASGQELSFDVQRYQPMERLLASEDLEFLQQLPGYNPKMASQWKREQRRIFRLYLGELAQDFNRMHETARMMAAVSPEASATVVSLLISQKVSFWRAMASLEIRLMMPNAVGSMSVRPLLDSLQGMCMQLENGLAAGAAA